MITTKQNYLRHLEQLEHLMACNGSFEAIETLSKSVVNYEALHFPIENARPNQILTHLIENRDSSLENVAKDLDIDPLIMGEYVTDQRPLTRDHIVLFSRYFKVNLRVFLREEESK